MPETVRSGDVRRGAHSLRRPTPRPLLPRLVLLLPLLAIHRADAQEGGVCAASLNVKPEICANAPGEECDAMNANLITLGDDVQVSICLTSSSTLVGTNIGVGGVLQTGTRFEVALTCKVAARPREENEESRGYLGCSQLRWRQESTFQRCVQERPPHNLTRNRHTCCRHHPCRTALARQCTSRVSWSTSDSSLRRACRRISCCRRTRDARTARRPPSLSLAPHIDHSHPSLLPTFTLALTLILAFASSSPQTSLPVSTCLTVSHTPSGVWVPDGEPGG